MINAGPFANVEDVSEVSNEGERYVPLIDPYCAAMHLGHMAAYKHALRYAYGRKVLDLGCGTGYGSHFLASFGAEQVVAADLDWIALNYARKNYFLDCIQYVQLNGNNSLPFADQSFDFVFCSQVIEHLSDPPGFLLEIRRILKSSGFCLVTTPNKKLFTPDPDQNSNEHHISEMSFSEYKKLGEIIFPLVKMGGIPQNCLVTQPDKTVSVKLNEDIVLENYRIQFHQVEECENLLLLGHEEASGQFEETLPDKYMGVSLNLRPIFWDPSPGVEQWVTMGMFPGTCKENDTILYSKGIGGVNTTVFSPYDALYRIDIGLLYGGNYKIEVTLRMESATGPVVYHTMAQPDTRKLRLVFPPVTDSAQQLFHLELHPKCHIWHYLVNRKGVPRFEFHEGQLPAWTFHQTLP
jgi:ubiquinone/menaquinone biosynthesis C-methylase UbiE